MKKYEKIIIPLVLPGPSAGPPRRRRRGPAAAPPGGQAPPGPRVPRAGSSSCEAWDLDMGSQGVSSIMVDWLVL